MSVPQVMPAVLERYTRNEAQRHVEELGGRTTSSVSGETDYLVAGDAPGKKYEEAEQQGVEILNEQQFEKLLSGSED
jgi:DNA ligase (NAD+)